MRLTTIVLGFLVSMFSLAPTASELGQETREAPSASDDEWANFAKTYLEITEISAEFQAELALPENKSEEAQTRVRESMRQKIQQVLQAHGLSETRYSQMNFVISTNDERRDAFTQLLEELRAEEDTDVGG